jgi:hypothetical protein
MSAGLRRNENGDAREERTRAHGGWTSM